MISIVAFFLTDDLRAYPTISAGVKRTSRTIKSYRLGVIDLSSILAITTRCASFLDHPLVRRYTTLRRISHNRANSAICHQDGDLVMSAPSDRQ